MESAGRKPRSDALHNRERLIAAAKDILGQGGPEASLEAIARRAGLGIGTLYRHFPTREALFLAVYASEVAQTADTATELESARDGLEALRGLLHAMVSLVETKRGLIGALSVAMTEKAKVQYSEASAPLGAAMGRLVARAQADGTVRTDVTTQEIVSTVVALCYARHAEPGWKAHVLRMIDIFVDGLRPPRPRGG
jgi:AcrR family transcriptional regulator